jgi:hypothetical protein
MEYRVDQLLMRLEGAGKVFLEPHTEVGIVCGGKQRLMLSRGRFS